MHEAKLVGDLGERFGVAQEKITRRLEVGKEMLDDAALGGNVEINQDVAATDKVHALHKDHLGVVAKIQAREGDAGTDFVFDPQLVTIGWREVLTPVEVT